jgi:transcriptional regulator with XRE-family HTH domain
MVSNDTERREVRPVGRLWDLIEQHRDAQHYPPSYRQLAIKLGVSQSTFETWKAPKALPTRESLEAISKLVGISYQTVLDAALEDTRYRVPPSHELKEREGHDRSTASSTRAAGSAATETTDQPDGRTQAAGDDGTDHATTVSARDIAAGGGLPRVTARVRSAQKTGRTQPRSS